MFWKKKNNIVQENIVIVQSTVITELIEEKKELNTRILSQSDLLEDYEGQIRSLKSTIELMSK